MRLGVSLGLAATALVGVLWLGACGGDSGGPGNTTTIDQIQAQAMGEEAASQIGALAAGITGFGFSASSPGGGLFSRVPPAARVINAAASRGGPALREALALLDAGAGQCDPTVSDPTDHDADGVLDDAVLTFNCSFTDAATGYPVTVRGSVSVSDPAASLFGYQVGFNRFTISTTFPTQQGDQVVAFQFDGTTGVNVSSTAGSATEDITWRVRLNGTRVLLVSNAWQLGFTPDQGNTIDPASGSAPAGEFTVDGQFSWEGDYAGARGSWGFGVHTVAPLVYDGVCTDPEWPFESGTIRGQITANTSVGFTVDFQGCGTMPTVTLYGSGA